MIVELPGEATQATDSPEGRESRCFVFGVKPTEFIQTSFYTHVFKSTVVLVQGSYLSVQMVS